MYSINDSIEIAASIKTLRIAIATRDGLRGWLNDDTEVDAAGRYRLPFAVPDAPRTVTLTLDRADDRSVVMTCVDEENNPDWMGTELTLTLTPLAGGKTRVDLRHAGYAKKNEDYERSVKGWAHFLSSLAKYATTGKGEPFSTKAASQGGAS